MANYIIRRILLAILTTFFITIASFAIISLPPGDFVDAYVAAVRDEGSVITEADQAALRQLYGLDKPLYVQYVRWMRLVFQGSFGFSLEHLKPVREVIGDRLGLTVIVSLGSVLLTWAVALPVGIYSAMRQYSIGDYAFTFFGFLGIAVPNFLLALVIMYLGFSLFDLDVGGLFSIEHASSPWSWERVKDLLAHLPVPVFVIGMAGTGASIRIMRANLLDELRKPYVVTARAKGMPEARLVLKYPVRVALNPFASTVGYLLPSVFSGAVIVAVVLSLPTLGPILLKALVNQDMFLGGSIILMISVLTVIGTLLSDLLLLWIDPRIRVAGRDA